MKEDRENTAAWKKLQDRARALLKSRPSPCNERAPAELRELIENLSIHQIEIEMQNDELRRTRDSLERSQRKYFELYDLAPVGYVTMNAKGIILEINLTAADLLGFPRSRLISKNFARFVFPDFQDMFHAHCHTVLQTLEKNNCELKLVRKDGKQCFVQMDTLPVPMKEGGAGELRSTMTDITERKLLESTLLESKKTIQALNDANSESALLLDRQGTVLMINETAARRLGQSPEAMIGLKIHGFLPPEISKQRRGRFHEVLSLRRPLDYQDSRMGRRYHHTLQPLLDAKGEVEKVAVFARDTTLDHEALEALVESEKKYRLLVNTAPIGIVVTQDGFLKLVNPQAVSMSGYSEPELTSRPFVEIVHPDDREMVSAFHTRRLDGEEVPETYLMRIVTKSGETKWIENKGVLIIWKGGPATQNFLFDVTERHLVGDALCKSEARFRQIIENAPFGYYRVGKDGRYQFVNAAWEKMFGYISSEIVGRRFEWNEPADFKRQAREMIFRALSGETFKGEFCRQLKNGAVGYHAYSIQPVYENDEVVAIEGFVGDITRHKQAEEKIHELSHLLIQAQEKERYLISCELHDSIAQNLSVLKINHEMISGELSVISPGLRGRLASSSGLLSQTITDVRNLAYDLRLPGLDEMGLVKALEIYCEEISEKGKTKVDFQTAGMSVIDLDRNMEIHIYRLIQEALNNIRKHADAGQATILLLGSSPNIILRIEDNGRGFDVKAQELLSAATKRMGLRGMQERVSLLQGRMTIQSQPMKGARILIRIPLP